MGGGAFPLVRGDECVWTDDRWDGRMTVVVVVDDDDDGDCLHLDLPGGTAEPAEEMRCCVVGHCGREREEVGGCCSVDDEWVLCVCT